MINKKAIKPVFIFSMPRSGSTLLQRVIATNEQVSTVSEPWILLPFLYGLKKEGVYAEYSHFSVYHAIQDLCKEMPNGEEEYLSAVRTAALHIYGSIAQESAVYFLDKTPRYALVVEQIIRTFPDGKFIFLWRNPLSVIGSIVETFYLNKWKLFHSKIDLFDGQANLIEAGKKYSSSALSIKYEDLVKNPYEELGRLEKYLDLDYDSSKLRSFSSITLNGGRGDPTGAKKYTEISTKSIESWKHAITNPWRKYWCRKYLNWLGKERLQIMGYDLDELILSLGQAQNKWDTLVSDLLYSLYGTFYCVLEFKILKDKYRKIMKRKTIKKHD